MIVQFNNPQNKQAKLFLISAKAGGQGINLTGANRIILLDTSWNPSVDQQSIFRIFRYGQTKKCYIYRLLSMGTMEEKIYSRSVTKQAMSFRVIDKQQIDRNYNLAELEELYTLTKPDMSERPVPIEPKDELLANLLNKFPNQVYKYHEHNSLLDNKMDEDITEEEQQEAIMLHRQNKSRNELKKILANSGDSPAVASTSNAVLQSEQVPQSSNEIIQIQISQLPKISQQANVNAVTPQLASDNAAKKPQQSQLTQKDFFGKTGIRHRTTRSQQTTQNYRIHEPTKFAIRRH